MKSVRLGGPSRFLLERPWSPAVFAFYETGVVGLSMDLEIQWQVDRDAVTRTELSGYYVRVEWMDEEESLVDLRSGQIVVK